MCICITGIRNFEVPLTFRPGNRYRVTVRGLRPKTSAAMTSDAGPAADTTTFDVMCKGSIEFRTGEGQLFSATEVTEKTYYL